MISGNTNVNKNTSELLVVPELIATRRAIKPFIFQIREKPHLVSKNSEQDDNVFWNKEFVYGCDARYNAGYGLWQLAYGSTGKND